MKTVKDSYPLRIDNVEIPLISLKTSKEGPKILLTACMHGDEKGSNAVAKQLLKALENNLNNGEIYVFPLLNPIGFKQNSRLFNKIDLNDSFPGKEKGNLTQKIAYKIFTKIVQIKPDLVLDLHNDWKKSIHYALIDPKQKDTAEKIYNKTIQFGKSLTIPFVLDTDNLENSLSFQLLKNNIPSLVIELERVDEGVKLLLNFLSSLSMLKHKTEMNIRPEVRGKLLKYSLGPLASKEGFVKFLTLPGKIVEKGYPLAQIIDHPKVIETLYSQDKAIVLSLTDSVKIKPKEQVVALGIL